MDSETLALAAIELAEKTGGDPDAFAAAMDALEGQLHADEADGRDAAGAAAE